MSMVLALTVSLAAQQWSLVVPPGPFVAGQTIEVLVKNTAWYSSGNTHSLWIDDPNIADSTVEFQEVAQGPLWGTSITYFTVTIPEGWTQIRFKTHGWAAWITRDIVQ